jgi:capsular exopolysaccharide synthesis family protein
MQKLALNLYQNRSRVLTVAYESLIANLYLCSRGAPPKTVAIAGIAPGIGRTTVAINLAIALSLAEKRVLFLDADVSKAMSEKRLQPDLSLGLSDYLDGQAEYEDILTETNYSGLSLIACGDLEKQKAVGLLYTQRFAELLEKIDKAYDFAIFDTPPWGAEAAVIASKCAGTFFLAELNQTRKDDLKKAIDQLNDVGTPLLGVLLNKVKKKDYR